MAALSERFDAVLENPQIEVLIETERDEITSFAVLSHGQVEGSTRRPESRVEFPSWLTGPELVEMAVARARARGAEVLCANVPVDEPEQCAIYVAAGMLAECKRIVLDLDRFGAKAPQNASRDASALRRVLERSTRSTEVRPAEYSDRLFLMLLASECVTMMFHQRRESELAAIQERFFDSYARLDFDHESTLRAWVASVADGSLAGSILIEPLQAQMPDGRWQAYINDLSVLPAYWGRSVGAALALQAIEALQEQGVRYLTADVSTDNQRVWSLAHRLGFVEESLRFVTLLT